MIKVVKSVITFWVLITLNSACLDDPDCYQLNNNIVGITFKDITTSASISIDSIAVLSDTLLLVDTIATSALFIPVNYLESSTAFVIPEGKEVHHLTLGYKSQSQYVTQDCGARFVVSDLTVVSHDFDSVRLVNATPGDNEEARNIEIFW